MPAATSVGLGNDPVKSPPAVPVGAEPEIQLSVPVPLVVSSWPLAPSAAGSVQEVEPARVSGAFSDRALLEPLSVRTSLLAVVALPWMVTLPATVCAPELIVAEVLMIVEPPIDEDPLIAAAVRVL